MPQATRLATLAMVARLQMNLPSAIGLAPRFKAVYVGRQHLLHRPERRQPIENLLAEGVDKVKL